MLAEPLPLMPSEPNENPYKYLFTSVNAYYEAWLGNQEVEDSKPINLELRPSADRIKDVLILLRADPSRSPQKIAAFNAMLRLMELGELYFQACIWDYFADLKAIALSLGDKAPRNAKKIIDQIQNTPGNQFLAQSGPFHRRRLTALQVYSLHANTTVNPTPWNAVYNLQQTQRALGLGAAGLYAGRLTVMYTEEDSYRDKIYVADQEGRQRNDFYWFLIPFFTFAQRVPIVGPGLLTIMTGIGYVIDFVNEFHAENQIRLRHERIANSLSKEHSQHEIMQRNILKREAEIREANSFNNHLRGLLMLGKVLSAVAWGLVFLCPLAALICGSVGEALVVSARVKFYHREDQVLLQSMDEEIQTLNNKIAIALPEKKQTLIAARDNLQLSRQRLIAERHQRMLQSTGQETAITGMSNFMLSVITPVILTTIKVAAVAAVTHSFAAPLILATFVAAVSNPAGWVLLGFAAAGLLMYGSFKLYQWYQHRKLQASLPPQLPGRQDDILVKSLENMTTPIEKGDKHFSETLPLLEDDTKSERQKRRSSLSIVIPDSAPANQTPTAPDSPSISLTPPIFSVTSPQPTPIEGVKPSSDNLSAEPEEVKSSDNLSADIEEVKSKHTPPGVFTVEQQPAPQSPVKQPLHLARQRMFAVADASLPSIKKQPQLLEFNDQPAVNAGATF